MFVNGHDKLTSCQQRVLRSISIMQPSDLYLFGGESGTGKTLTLFTAMNMVCKSNPHVRLLYIAPNAKMLENAL